MQKIFKDIDKSSPIPLYIQLSEILTDYAKQYQLKSGDVLPSENELLSRFKVSRHTIRLAVERLVQSGTARKVRGQGTFFMEKKSVLPVYYPHAFNGSLERLGLHVSNKLIDHKVISGKIDWIEGLNSTNWEEPVWIRRLKSAQDELLAIDERILSGSVVKRYSKEEIENENLFLDLMGRNLDTQTKSFNYTFVAHPLTKEESNLLQLPLNTQLLRRVGEYYNSMEERFMLSRLTILSDRITLRYEYSMHKEGWSIKG